MDIQLKTGCFDDAALVRRVVFMDEQGYEMSSTLSTRIRTAFM